MTVHRKQDVSTTRCNN